MKELGARWDKASKAWRLPPIKASLLSLARLYGADKLEWDYESHDYVRRPWGFDRSAYDSRRTDATNLRYPLYEYQKEAVHFLCSSPHRRSLLRLDPGLGKGLTSLAAATALGKNRILIIAPLSMLPTWKNEVKKWLGIDASIHHGTLPSLSLDGIYITNYESIVAQMYWAKRKSDDAWIVLDSSPYLKIEPFDLIIADESILVSNAHAKRTLALQALEERTIHFWELSGNPTGRYADDLYAQFKILFPQYFTSYWRFVHMYCTTVETTWGTQITGTKTSIDLRTEFSDIMFSVTKDDAKLGLPPLLYENIDVELEEVQLQAYREMLTKFIVQLETGEEMRVRTKLAQIIRLQQIVSNLKNLGPTFPDISAKDDALIEYIKLARIETPCVIWTQWVPGAIELEAKLRSLGAVGIATGQHDGRINEIEAFKNGRRDFLIVSLGVGKFGHTLTNARSMVYRDRSWKADDYIQSLNRVHRIGLDHSPTIFPMRASNTIDELIEKNLRQKMISIAHISNSDLATLLKGLTG